MKTKILIISLGLGLLMLAGCTPVVGAETNDLRSMVIMGYINSTNSGLATAQKFPEFTPIITNLTARLTTTLVTNVTESNQDPRRVFYFLNDAPPTEKWFVTNVTLIETLTCEVGGTPKKYVEQRNWWQSTPARYRLKQEWELVK